MPMLGQVADILLVVLGFGFIIFIHELGHFLAARWAGVRVLAFAIGFGSALVSYRKGLGLRRGSSENEYRVWLRSRGATGAQAGVLAGEVSPTEYRLNVLPLGGYVKMLGQDDSDPSATSDSPDSFTRAPVYKRMVIISAGVVMNLVTAALLFIVVFSAGLKSESPRLGMIVGPAAKSATTQVGGATLTGLQAGDVVIGVGGESVESFKDIGLAVAMSPKGEPIEVLVQRPGRAEPLSFIATPTVDPGTGLLSLGVMPAFSGTLSSGKGGRTAEEVAMRLRSRGIEGVVPGMSLLDASGAPLDFAWLQRAAAESEGKAIPTRWGVLDDDGKVTGPVVETLVRPRGVIEEGPGEIALGGLLPVMRVGAPSEAGVRAGLKPGDVFARIGPVQWPDEDTGRALINGASPGGVKGTIRVVVLREGRLVDLGEVVVEDGRIGFDISQDFAANNLLASPAEGSPAERAGLLAGTRVVRVNGEETADLIAVREGMKRAVGAVGEGKDVTVELTVELPVPAGEPVTRVTRGLSLSKEEAGVIAGLGWATPLTMDLFEAEQVVLRRDGPVAAIGKGLQETKKMVLTTYLTFARLFQGSVKVEHIKGPIGITQTGTILAEKGTVWLLFFLAAVSVNLAVVNFLPLPIVDGGHFCFLLWEQFTGRPVSPAVQNVAALIGLVLIGAVFLVTTYNDLANLLWR